MSHPNYDEFWQARNLRPHLKKVRAAVMTVGGWYDAEDLFGPLEVYKETERQNPGIYNVLVMGPWFHGQWSGTDGDRLGNVAFDAKTAEYYREHIELPFLKHFLKDEEKDEEKSDDDKKDKPKKFNLAEANVFETGTNQWRRFDAWPPKNTAERTLYLHAGGRLSFDPPSGDDKNAFDEYVSDPAKPVPYIGFVSTRRPNDYMLGDQRFAATRPDVLVYQTDEIKEAVTLAGPISVQLQVSTTGTDSDFVVKLIDVYSTEYPEPGSESNERPDGRLPTARPRRADARQVPQQFRNAGAIHARPNDGRQLDDARRLPHLPPRPPHHDPDPKLLVPVGRSQSAKILRHLPGHRSRFPKSDSACVPLAASGFCMCAVWMC